MKTELRPKPHSIIPGAVVIEVWHDGRLLATIAGADRPGIRVITKHGIIARPAPDDGTAPTSWKSRSPRSDCRYE